jgi:hypothetical protein
MSNSFPPTARSAAAVLDFQMWCWGQDVHHPDGNLLLAAGLVRHRPPAGEEGSTCYRVALPSGAEVLLWGFGVVCRTAGESALVLKRHAFALRLVPAARLTDAFWRPTQLPRGALVRSVSEAALVRARFAELTAWMAGYERRTIAAVGAAWRHECARRRPRAQRHRLPVAPDTLADAWERIAQFPPSVPAALCAASPDTLAS